MSLWIVFTNSTLQMRQKGLSSTCGLDKPVESGKNGKSFMIPFGLSFPRNKGQIIRKPWRHKIYGRKNRKRTKGDNSAQAIWSTPDLQDITVIVLDVENGSMSQCWQSKNLSTTFLWRKSIWAVFWFSLFCLAEFKKPRLNRKLCLETNHNTA